jgi:hypothetical protein
MLQMMMEARGRNESGAPRVETISLKMRVVW